MDLHLRAAKALRTVVAAALAVAGTVTAASAQDADAAQQIHDCVCALPAPVNPDPSVRIGVTTDVSGQAWFSGPNGPFEVEQSFPISLSVLPLTTGANASVIASFGDSCDVSVSQLRDLNVVPVFNEDEEPPEIEFLCVIIDQSDPTPVQAATIDGSAAAAAAALAALIAAGVVFGLRDDDGPSVSK